MTTDLDKHIEDIQAFHAQRGWIGAVSDRVLRIGEVFTFRCNPSFYQRIQLIDRLNQMGRYRVIDIASSTETAAWHAIVKSKTRPVPVYKCEVLPD